MIGIRALNSYVYLTDGLHTAGRLVIAACVAFTPMLLPPVSSLSGDSAGTYQLSARTAGIIWMCRHLILCWHMSNKRALESCQCNFRTQSIQESHKISDMCFETLCFFPPAINCIRIYKIFVIDFIQFYCPEGVRFTSSEGIFYCLTRVQVYSPWRTIRC
jgi:hypothetical protein